MGRLGRTTPKMGASVYKDLLRRIDEAVTFDELRALRRFVRKRLEGDDRLADFEESVERKAMTMIADSDAAAKERRN